MLFSTFLGICTTTPSCIPSPTSSPFPSRATQQAQLSSQLPVPASAWSGVHKNVRSPADCVDDSNLFPFFDQARHTITHVALLHSFCDTLLLRQSFSVTRSRRSLAPRSRTRNDSISYHFFQSSRQFGLLRCDTTLQLDIFRRRISFEVDDPYSEPNIAKSAESSSLERRNKHPGRIE